MQKQRGQDALNLYQQVIQLNPHHAEAHHQMGILLYAAGNIQTARDYLERAIQCDASSADSYLVLAMISESANQGMDALKLVLHTAMNVAPDYAPAHAAVVNTMWRQQQSHMVLPYLENVLARFPNDQELHEFYCMALKIGYRFDDATIEYKKLCKRWRVNPGFRLMFETYIPRLSQSGEEIDRQRAELSETIERFISEKPRIHPNSLSYNPLFALAFHNRDNKALLSRYTEMLRVVMPQLNYVAAHTKQDRQEGKIRIAFVSAHMHLHSVGNCYRNAMLYLAAQDEFEVEFFQLTHVMDAGIQQILDAGVTLHHLPLNIESAREKIAAFMPDIVIYPDIGMHVPTHYLAMARLARYQCCFQGHPETTGINTIDYVISSRTYEPEHAGDNYAEQLLCNKGIDTVFKRPIAPTRWLTREELGLPTDRKLYVCPMAIQKFHPDFDKLLASILDADPQATLVLFRDFDQQGASELLQKRILLQCDATRVIFLDWQPLESLFSILKTADAVLDTIYFGGGTTAQYCFGFGIPIVTMPGKYARGRVVHSYYQVMGIENPPEVNSVAAYVAQAIKLANDPIYAETLSNEILANNEKLFEKSNYGEELVQLMRDIFVQDLDAYQR